MKRSPLRRGAPPKRTGRPRARSKRRESEAAERRAVVELVHRRDRTCRAAAVVPEVECRGPLDVHEVIPRSAWAAGYLVPSNAKLVCRSHHSWIGDYPAEAKVRGLRGSAWDR